MSAGLTPGPWTVGRDSNYPASFGIIEGVSFPITYVLWATDVTHEMGKQRDRDATLIAAAPDLYEALDEYLHAVSRSATALAAEKAKAALAKARGQ